MALQVNLPLGWALVSLNFSGSALPNQATSTFACETDTETPASLATLVRTELRAANRPFAVATSVHGLGIALANVHVKFGPTATGPEAEVGDGAGIGNPAGECVPPNTSYLLTKNTAQGGRRGRGRMFLPGLQEAIVNSGGTVLDPQFTTLQTQWSAFATAMAAAGNGLSLLHTYDPVLGEVPIPPSAVLSLTLSSRVATQRNRLRR